MRTSAIKFLSSTLIAIAALPMMPGSAFAQNLGGVFGPVVNEGHRSAEYRLSFVPDFFDSGETAYAHRLHYQQAINSDLMVRGVVVYNDQVGQDPDFSFVQGELFWQMTPDGQPWQSGFRFDARLRDEGRPGLIGAHWTNQVTLSKNWQTRFIVLSSLDVGDNARDGVFLQSRANLSRKAAGGHVGVEMFNAYGSTENFGSFDEQRHQIGPFAMLPVTDDWSVFMSALVGVSDAAPDSDLRFRLTREF